MKSYIIILSTALLLSACATSTNIGNNVAYGDPNAVETLTNDFGSTDLLMIAHSMTNSLLQSPVIANAQRPILTLAEVKNKTSEYIDTAQITEKIRTQLLKSGAVRFGVGINDMQSQVDELQRQTQSGLYAQGTASKKGNMQAAKYRLEGSIGSIVKRSDGTKDVFYLFTLTLVNNETGLIEWTDDKEIRKTSN